MNKQKNERLPFKTVMAYSRRGFAIWWKAEPEILIAAAVQRAVEALRESVEQFQAKGWSFVVGTAHTYRTPEAIRDWQRTLEDNFPGIPACHGELALSIGCHTGPGAFGMGLVRRVELPRQ